MNRYETFVIFEADLPEEDRKTILDRIESIISKDSGSLLIFDEWGSRKLAYPIGKKNQGYYVRVDYCAPGKTVEAIEKILRQDHRIMRFMTVRLEADADPEALKAEMAEPEEKPVTAVQEEESAAVEEAAGEEVAETDSATAGVENETAAIGENESESAEKE